MRISKAGHREVKQLLTKLGETDEGAERAALANEVVTQTDGAHGDRRGHRVSAGEVRGG